MILEEAENWEAIVFDFLEGAGLEIQEHEAYDALVMDMYIPEMLRGRDADSINGEVILQHLSKVDGHGSGLDADTVDGLHGGELLAKDPLLAGQVLVGAADGGVADGGNYEEFVNAFNSEMILD